MSKPTAGGGSSHRPIIRKVKKGGGHKHHGGSWKVAYADFVTAMMAFFLLMWLLASTNETEKAEIASYFKRPMSAVFSGGSKPGGQQLVASSEGGREGGLFSPGADSTGEAYEARVFAELQEELQEIIEDHPNLSAFKDQIRLELTDEGLRIQLTDELQRPMFTMGSVNLQPYARDILREIAHVLNDVPNGVIISGHTDATVYAGGETSYSNWELSSDRANAARRELVDGGILEGKVLRVEGLASSFLLNAADPFDPANRRISILLLNYKTEKSLRQSDLLRSLGHTEAAKKTYS